MILENPVLPGFFMPCQEMKNQEPNLRSNYLSFFDRSQDLSWE